MVYGIWCVWCMVQGVGNSITSWAEAFSEGVAALKNDNTRPILAAVGVALECTFRV